MTSSMDSEVCHINIEISKVSLLDSLFALWLTRSHDCPITELLGAWNRAFLGAKSHSALFPSLYFNHDYNSELWVTVVCASQRFNATCDSYMMSLLLVVWGHLVLAVATIKITITLGRNNVSLSMKWYLDEALAKLVSVKYRSPA